MCGLGVTSCQKLSKSYDSFIELFGDLTSGSIRGDVDHCDPAIETKRLSMSEDQSDIPRCGPFSHLLIL
jgi:hypothetical protein